MTTNKARITKDAANNKIIVVKTIDAPLEQVWNAWTTPEQLDKWWGPKPWKAVTKKMNFSAGGSWVYIMQGPKGEQQWDKFEFTKIDKYKDFSATDMFIDQQGERNSDMPSGRWKVSFFKSGDGTKIESEISYDNKEDMDKILKMGFEEGFTIGLDQLDELFSH